MKKCVFAAAFAVLSGFATASYAGLTFRMVSSVDGSTAQEMQVSVEGGLMKAEVLGGSQANPMMPVGSYMLMREDGMYLVNPSARSFMRFDMTMLSDTMRAFNEAGLGGGFEISDVSVEKTIDEPGETIEGYPTRHVQFKSGWVMQMAGSPMKMTTSSVEDMWVTDQVTVPANAGMAFDQSVLPEAVQELLDAQGLKDIGGFPLRTVTQQATETDMGMRGLGGRLAQRMMNRATAGGNVTTTTEARDIREADIPLEAFEIPAEYTETQLFGSGAGVPDLNSIQN